jgi:hypothetical protein
MRLLGTFDDFPFVSIFFLTKRLFSNLVKSMYSCFPLVNSPLDIIDAFDLFGKPFSLRQFLPSYFYFYNFIDLLFVIGRLQYLITALCCCEKNNNIDLLFCYE